jgi:hypothetical protein
MQRMSNRAIEPGSEFHFSGHCSRVDDINLKDSHLSGWRAMVGRRLCRERLGMHESPASDGRSASNL